MKIFFTFFSLFHKKKDPKAGETEDEKAARAADIHDFIIGPKLKKSTNTNHPRDLDPPRPWHPP